MASRLAVASTPHSKRMRGCKIQRKFWRLSTAHVPPMHQGRAFLRHACGLLVWSSRHSRDIVLEVGSRNHPLPVLRPQWDLQRQTCYSRDCAMASLLTSSHGQRLPQRCGHLVRIRALCATVGRGKGEGFDEDSLRKIERFVPRWGAANGKGSTRTACARSNF